MVRSQDWQRARDAGYTPTVGAAGEWMREGRNLFAGCASGDDTTRLYGNGCAEAMRDFAGRCSTGDRIDGGWSKTIGGMLGT